MNLHKQFQCISDVDVETGAISFSCFQRLLPRARSDQADPAKIFFSIIDHNKDGLIKFDEFVLCLSVAYRGSLEERIDYAFRAYDSDGSGLVTRDELSSVINAYHIISMALIKDFMRSLEKSMLEVFDDKSGNTVSSVFGGPIRSYSESDIGRSVHVNRDTVSKSSDESFSDRDKSSPLSLSQKSDICGLGDKVRNLDRSPGERVDDTCDTSQDLHGAAGRRNISIGSLQRRSSIITSQLEGLYDGTNMGFTRNKSAWGRKDSLLVDSFAENAIKLEIEHIFLGALPVNRPDDAEEGFDFELFSSISIQEPNIINAVFDSITCIF